VFPSRLDADRTMSLRQRPDSTTTANAEQSTPSVSGIVDAIITVGRQRNELLANLRSALESSQTEKAISLARRLCGLSE
jgi:hypothetical protein